MKDTIKVTIAQYTDGSKTKEEFSKLFDRENGMKYLRPEKQLDKFYKGVRIAKQDGADFLVFPELFIPNEYVDKHIMNECESSKMVIIGGLEWVYKGPINGKKMIENQAFVAIPSTLNKNVQTLNERATIIKIPKLFPAPAEKDFLNKAGYQFVHGNRIYLFKSEKLGNWAVLICVDYLNLPVQRLLQTRIQTLFIVAYNKDIDYFHSLSDSLHRILYCNVIVCNMGNYGGSHAFVPYRDRHKRNVYKNIGNHVNAAVTIELPLKLIADAQKAPSDQVSKELVSRPPDYGLAYEWGK